MLRFAVPTIRTRRWPRSAEAARRKRKIANKRSAGASNAIAVSQFVLRKESFAGARVKRRPNSSRKRIQITVSIVVSGGLGPLVSSMRTIATQTALSADSSQSSNWRRVFHRARSDAIAVSRLLFGMERRAASGLGTVEVLGALASEARKKPPGGGWSIRRWAPGRVRDNAKPQLLLSLSLCVGCGGAIRPL
jgi:hypothetical protein